MHYIYSATTLLKNVLFKTHVVYTILLIIKNGINFDIEYLLIKMVIIDLLLFSFI
jgi:hypothetical protein